MLLDEIASAITSMKSLSKAEQIVTDQDKKDNDDKSFSELVDTFYADIKTYESAKKSLGFSIDEGMQQKLILYAESLQNTIKDNEVNDSELASAQKMKKDILTIFSSNWNRFYSRRSKGYLGNLGILAGLIDDESIVDSIKADISNAANWNNLRKNNNGKNNLNRYKEGTDQIDNLLKQQNLTDEVRNFLIAAGRGKADIDDLTDEVLEWIKNKHQQKKFVISFANLNK